MSHQTGSPSWIKGRTFAAGFELTFLGKGRQVKHSKLKKTYRNPITIVWEWRHLAYKGLNQAGVCRNLGVSGARVMQIPRLLDLAPEVVASMEAFGNPMRSQTIGGRTLRPPVGFPPKEQAKRICLILTRAGPMYPFRCPRGGQREQTTQLLRRRFHRHHRGATSVIVLNEYTKPEIRRSHRSDSAQRIPGMNRFAISKELEGIIDRAVPVSIASLLAAMLLAVHCWDCPACSQELLLLLDRVPSKNRLTEDQRDG